jgi:predicted transcriptional regulator
MPRKIRLTLEVSEDVNEQLEVLAKAGATTKSDVLRKAIALIKAASAGKAKGRELAFIDSKTERVVMHIMGL